MLLVMIAFNYKADNNGGGNSGDDADVYGGDGGCGGDEAYMKVSTCEKEVSWQSETKQEDIKFKIRWSIIQDRRWISWQL